MSSVLDQHWFHTSTQPDWPSADYDPTAHWTAEFIEDYERAAAPGALERYRQDQRRKLLHVGTYRAAVENMQRRRRDQGDHGSTFYLYRVRLASDAIVRPDAIAEQSDLVGDVLPEDVLRDGEDIAQYVNEHEDVGSISLAIRRSAIAAVQGVPIRSDDEEAHLAALNELDWRAL